MALNMGRIAALNILGEEVHDQKEEKPKITKKLKGSPATFSFNF